MSRFDTMKDDSQSALSIEALPEGGYIVYTDGAPEGMRCRMQWFATESIDAALTFMRNKMKHV